MNRTVAKNVVDSNYLQREEFRKFLERSRRNFAVLPDYVAMEAYKGDSLKSIQCSMAIACEFPKQIIILKSTIDVCGLKGRPAGLQRRIIDHDQTREFSQFCRGLSEARGGNKSAVQSILDHGSAAKDNINRAESDAALVIESIEQLSLSYKKIELDTIRRGGINSDILDRIIKDTITISGLMFADHPKVQQLPPFNQLANTYIFRLSLCFYFLAMRWIEVGGAKSVSQKRMRNDMVDCHIAAYATYFDGLLTEDKKLAEIYETANTLIPRLQKIWS